ncbi:MAG: hypothetical protein EBZ77_12925 [Chitinophagia bacterium]|nr:hypothetical protein [Chitinophagia bacterium]
MGRNPLHYPWHNQQVRCSCCAAHRQNPAKGCPVHCPCERCAGYRYRLPFSFSLVP